MLTSYYDFEEQRHIERVERAAESMVAPSVEEVAELAESERLK
jgi:hypothetical protein